MTYAPRAGVSDADRNCISNVRPQGTSYAEAAYKLHYLLERSRLFGKSGVAIKDNSEWVPSGRLLF
jgi:ethanolamine ammonia-lyase small subunit